MTVGNDVKAEQLGMPYGTATQRLRKIIIFNLVKETGKDICFKCSKRISKIEELSIEHKQPWLHVTPDLFWDYKNIAFSHLRCNKPDRPSGGKGLRIKAPNRTAWCNRHKQFLPISQFSKNKWHWSGVHTLCKQCQHYNRA